MFRLDASLFRRLNNQAGKHPALDAVASFCAEWLIVTMFAAVFLSALGLWNTPALASESTALFIAGFRGLAAAALGFAGNWVISQLLFRPRPYVTLQSVHRIVSKPVTSFAFPSGHSTAAFALAFTLCILVPPLGLLMLPLALLVGVGRVFVGIHYPLDITAGIAVGLLWALAMHAIGSAMGDHLIVADILANLR